MIEIKDLLSKFNIVNFLVENVVDKFNNILLSEEGKKESVRSIISEVIEVEINSKDIKIKNNIIYLNIKPIYKNEIFLKQEKIFLKLQELFNQKAPSSIR